VLLHVFLQSLVPGNVCCIFGVLRQQLVLRLLNRSLDFSYVDVSLYAFQWLLCKSEKDRGMDCMVQMGQPTQLHSLGSKRKPMAE